MGGHLDSKNVEPTSVHWHGLAIDNAYDGVPGVALAPISPGSSYRYRFVVPDSGTYWYHSHKGRATGPGPLRSADRGRPRRCRRRYGSGGRPRRLARRYARLPAPGVGSGAPAHGGHADLTTPGHPLESPRQPVVVFLGVTARSSSKDGSCIAVAPDSSPADADAGGRRRAGRRYRDGPPSRSFLPAPPRWHRRP